MELPMKASLLLLLILSFCTVCSADVYLNELVSANVSVNTDYNGNYSDWIELYNNGATAVNLTGYHLSDDSSNLAKYTFPNVNISAGQFLVVWASDMNTVYPNGQVHLNFKVDNTGEDIYLSSPANTVIDMLPAVALPNNFSYGRQPDGTGSWLFFPVPTPGAANTGFAYTALLPDPVFSVESGLYTASFNLTITDTDPLCEIRYTTNGSEPTVTSTLYTQPISIHSMAGTPNKLSNIRTTIINTVNPDYQPDFWDYPSGEVFKGQVILAKAFRTGYYPSSTITKSYFVDPAILTRYQMPVLSVVTDSVNFFGWDTGIMIAGSHYNGNPDHWDTANFGQSGEAWERAVHFDLINANGTLGYAANCEAHIHGGGSRRFNIKAFDLGAESAYGVSKFNYQMFPQKSLLSYNGVIVRGGGQDCQKTTFRDAFMQQLI